MSSHGIDPVTWNQHAWLNRLQSLLLLGFMAGFLGLLGWLLWGADGLVGLLIGGCVLVLFSPSFSPRLIMQLYGAQPVSRQRAPALHAVAAELSERAGLEHVPSLYYIPSRIVNAFTVGRRERAAIAISDGFARVLDIDEQIGVLAHEISHVRSDDMWVMGLADTFSRVTSFLSLLGQILLLINLPLLLMSQVTLNWWVVLVLILAPGISALAQLGLSRAREYDADLNAARLTGDPEGLARALLKIERLQGSWVEQILLPGRRSPEPSLLRTHPHTEDRVARLMQLRQGVPGQRIDVHRRYPGPGRLLEGRFVRRAPRWHVTGLWH